MPFPKSLNEEPQEMNVFVVEDGNGNNSTVTYDNPPSIWVDPHQLKDALEESIDLDEVNLDNESKYLLRKLAKRFNCRGLNADSLYPGLLLRFAMMETEPNA